MPSRFTIGGCTDEQIDGLFALRTPRPLLTLIRAADFNELAMIYLRAALLESEATVRPILSVLLSRCRANPRATEPAISEIMERAARGQRTPVTEPTRATWLAGVALKLNGE